MLQGAALSGLNIYIAIYPGLHSLANSLITARAVHFRAYSPISLNINPKKKGLKVRKVSALAVMKELKRLNEGQGIRQYKYLALKGRHPAMLKHKEGLLA